MVGGVIVLLVLELLTPVLSGRVSVGLIVAGGPILNSTPPGPGEAGRAPPVEIHLVTQGGPVVARSTGQRSSDGRFDVRLLPGLYVATPIGGSGDGAPASTTFVVWPFLGAHPTVVVSVP